MVRPGVCPPRNSALAPCQQVLVFDRQPFRQTISVRWIRLALRPGPSVGKASFAVQALAGIITSG
jgi:hypothetical protein